MTVYFLDGDVQESYHPSLDEANTQADLTRNDYGSAVDHIDTVNVEMR
jgi:hypothetical protein